MILSADSQPVLIDFGLSKHYDDGGEQTTSTPVGVSHGYAPIEQYKQGGVSSFSPASDIYSLGATLYYLVCGVVPPSATDIGRDGIEIPVSHLSKGVCSAIKSAMSYWREDRPQSVEAFVALLDDVEEDDSLLLEAVVVEDDEKTVLPLSGGNIRVDVSSNNKHVDDGPKPIVNSDESSVKKSDYDALVVLLLYFFFGVWGVHRVYVGKYFSAICYMFTLAGLGIWALIDLINIVSGNFTDAEGRKVKF
jgi:serine/threonine protein kinase